jgi:hypothetical protein
MNVKNRQQLLTLVVIGAVILLAADKLVLGPLKNAWTSRSERIEELRKRVGEGRSLVEREDSLRARWVQMRTNTLPENASQAEQQVLRAFDRWSSDSRVSVLSINPQWKREADEYLTLQCRVEASGNLGAISRFIYELEHDPIAVKIESLELSARDSDGQQLALGLQVSGLALPTTAGSLK